MKIKAYRCDSVESAIRQARLELGEEAMLLDSRKTPPGERHLGLYEVRFAMAGAGESPEAAPAKAEISELSRGIEEIRSMLYSYTHSCYLPTGQILSQPELARIYRELADNDVDAGVAADLVARLLPAAERGAGRAELEQNLAQAVAALVPVSSEIGRPGASPGVIALVGPAGVGKTTTIAKLAIRYGLQRRRSVRLVTIDSFRVGAVDQIQSFASILGVELTAVEDVEHLNRSLEPGLDLALIDTPGHGFEQLEQAAEVAAFLRSREDIDTHLTLSASTKPKDLRRIIEKYTIFGPQKLLFTKLDETLSFGPLLNESIRNRWPLSFLGTGQRIPEDLCEATKSGVTDLILRRQRRPAGL